LLDVDVSFDVRQNRAALWICAHFDVFAVPSSLFVIAHPHKRRTHLSIAVWTFFVFLRGVFRLAQLGRLFPALMKS
jgi:hypothetical protein